MDATDAVSCAAVIFVLVALAVWFTPVLQLLRWIDIDEGRMKVFWSCAVFGAAYGAAFGSFCGPALWLPVGEGAFSAVIGGVLDGALLGAFGGGAAGFFGSVSGRRLGWWLAGVLGGATSAACLWIVSALAAGFEPNPEIVRGRIVSSGLAAGSAILLIGGLLGAALDRALQTGRSPVPGVQRLAARIRDVDRHEVAP